MRAGGSAEGVDLEGEVGARPAIHRGSIRASHQRRRGIGARAVGGARYEEVTLQANSEIARALRGPPLAELTIQDGDAHGGMRLGRVREQQEDAKEHSSREASGECDAPARGRAARGEDSPGDWNLASPPSPTRVRGHRTLERRASGTLAPGRAPDGIDPGDRSAPRPQHARPPGSSWSPERRQIEHQCQSSLGTLVSNSSPPPAATRE